MAQAIRSFIAVPSTENLRRALAGVVKRLEDSEADVRWERDSEKYHITLQFLGNVEPERLETLATALEADMQAHPPLEIVYEHLGAFPSLERPRVIWAGVRHNDALMSLQRSVEATCRRLGVGQRDDRPFHPHITIGRVRSPRNVARLTATLKSITLEPVSARSEHILLMRSELHPTGSRYTALKSLPLTS